MLGSELNNLQPILIIVVLFSILSSPKSGWMLIPITNKVPITACRKRRASKFNQFEIGSIAPTETFKYVVIRHYFDY